MKKRILSIIILVLICAFGLSSCALADDCRANCSHMYGFKKRTEPTCTSDGRIYRNCLKCFDTETVEVIPKLGHDFVYSWVNNNGCLGYREEGKCSRCSSGDGTTHTYFGSFNNSYYCYIHDYDFENPVSTIADVNDPECVVYEYKCKDEGCTEKNTIKLHKWDAETLAWYEENKDGGTYIEKSKKCETCQTLYYAYAYSFRDEYKVIKTPENSNDYALVGFIMQDRIYGRCVKLTYAEYNKLLAGEKINFPMPHFI